MNICKRTDIIRYIRNQGKLPTDPAGQILCPADLLVWFGLEEHLDGAEREIILQELEALRESELFLDRLQLAQPGGD